MLDSLVLKACSSLDFFYCMITHISDAIIQHILLYLLLQLSDGPLGEVSPGLVLLELGGYSLDLVLVVLLALVGLVLAYLQGLEVVGHHLQLLLKLHDLELADISTLSVDLELGLALMHLLGGRVVLGVGVLGHLLGLLELGSQGLQLLLVLLGPSNQRIKLNEN